MKLQVLGHSTAADGQSGEVHFRAVARTAHGALKMEEHSHFRRDEAGIGSMFLVKCSVPEDGQLCEASLVKACR